MLYYTSTDLTLPLQNIIEMKHKYIHDTSRMNIISNK